MHETRAAMQESKFAVPTQPRKLTAKTKKVILTGKKKKPSSEYLKISVHNNLDIIKNCPTYKEQKNKEYSLKRK